jgi:hypothetical protein
VRLTVPSQAELDALPADRRMELLELESQRQDRELQHRERERQLLDSERERRRAGRHQWINSGVLLLGALLAGGSLISTVLALRTGQEQLRAGQQELLTARESQITDRYIRAVEQLGSPQREVRLGAIYALERIAHDSARDTGTILDVLTAYVREHAPAPNTDDFPLGARPSTDIASALAVITRLPHIAGRPLDLDKIRIPHGRLSHAHLESAELTDSDLTDIDLTGADLHGAHLTHTHMTIANLAGANLAGADLSSTRLLGADLAGADLTGTDLRSADLRGVQGVTEQNIRNVAVTDDDTRFGPLPPVPGQRKNP